MKKLALIITCVIVASVTFAQEIQKDLKPFTRIVASPRINLILTKGDHESIRLVYHDVSKDKINIEVKGKTLSIYLDDARKVEKQVRYENHFKSNHGIYEGVSATAYVTYTALDHLEIRGEQELTCNDPIVSEEFTLRAYGENHITLASLKTEYFKATLYGENELRVKNGKVLEQKYKVYGENKIDTHEMKSEYTSTSIFGEGKLSINSSEQVRVNAFGEPQIYVDGGAEVSKRLVFGNVQIHKQ